MSHDFLGKAAPRSFPLVMGKPTTSVAPAHDLLWPTYLLEGLQLYHTLIRGAHYGKLLVNLLGVECGESFLHRGDAWIHLGSHEMDPPLDGAAVKSHNGGKAYTHHCPGGASTMIQELSIIGIDLAKSVEGVSELWYHSRAKCSSAGWCLVAPHAQRG